MIKRLRSSLILLVRPRSDGWMKCENMLRRNVKSVRRDNIPMAMGDRYSNTAVQLQVQVQEAASSGKNGAV